MLSKAPGYPYTSSNQVGDLDAVITQLRLQQVILVPNDTSGSPAIDWVVVPSALPHLVLLNTYHDAMPTVQPPEAIWLFSHGQCHRCLVIVSSVACISVRLGDFSEMAERR